MARRVQGYPVVEIDGNLVADTTHGISADFTADLPVVQRDGRDSIALGAQPVAARVSDLSSGGTQDNTKVAANYKVRHQWVFDCTNVRLVYANFGSAGDGANDITVRAGIDLGGRGVVPVWFNARRSVVIEPGALVVSDPVGVAMQKGSQAAFHSRTFVQVASPGQTWPTGLTLQAGGISTEGADLYASAPTDKSLTGTIASSTIAAYHPVAILGTPFPAPNAGRPTIAVCGDSVLNGVGDSVSNAGLVLRAFSAHPSATVGTATAACVMTAHSGQISTGLVDANAAERILQLTDHCSHAICGYGINDIANGNTLAQLQANLVSGWQNLARRGMKVYQTTLVPNHSLTAGQAAIRASVNDWIRTTPAPLTGYIEMADVLETSRNSNVYVGAYDSGDHIHPSGAGHTAVAAVVPVGQFT